jgi:DNA invertase Pin-like site-specific DNA recombinase
VVIEIGAAARPRVSAPSPFLEPLPEHDSEVFARMEAILRKIGKMSLRELDHGDARALLAGLPTAEYIRVSSGRQGERYGPPSQRRDLRRKIDRYGLCEPVAKYEDHITATGKVIRTDFLRMRADARAGKFKILLVGRVDRFARNALMGWLYIYELIACGVYVFFCDDDNVSGLDLGWKEKVTKKLEEAEAFIRVLTENINKSVEERREDGVFIGQVPFGWRWSEGAKVVVDQSQIHIVRRAFAIALGNDKLKLASIASQLNAEGHRYRDGSLFTKNRLHRMLTHPLAKGAWRIRKPGETRRGKAAWQVLEGKGETVVSPTQFNLLQDLLADRSLARRNPERIRREYVLARLLRCGELLPSGELCEAHFWARPGSTSRPYNIYKHASGIGCCSADIEATYWAPERGLMEQLEAFFAHAHLPQSAMEVVSRYLGERDNKAGLPDREKLLASFQNELKRIDIAFRRGAYGDEPLAAEKSWQHERRAVLGKIEELPPTPELPTEADRAVVLNLFTLWRKASNSERRRLADAVFQKLYVTRNGGPHLTKEGKVRVNGRAGIVRILPRPEHALLLALAFEGIKTDLPGQVAPAEGIWEARQFLGWLRGLSG